MKIRDYFKDKMTGIIIFFLTILSLIIILLIIGVNVIFIIEIISIIIVSNIIILIVDCLKRSIFYRNFKNQLDSLDKKYLITEIINESNFIEASLMLEYLYEIDKSMHEEINNYKDNNKEFREYIEAWCHEIKTPIATSKLIIENNQNKVTESIKEEIEKLEYHVDQVLFYARSDTVEKDYVIATVDLNQTVSDVIQKNRKTILNKKIKIIIEELGEVKSDSKWLGFIINQIIINSIKYSKEKPYIKISSRKTKNNLILLIEDNGIGIEKEDIERVFDKGFTGSNGRKKYNSTGIGLYLSRKLCVKLGHDISINSIVNEKTIVEIVFPNSDMMSIIR